MMQTSSLLVAAIGALALASALPPTALAQGTIAYFRPSQPIPVYYDPGIFPPAFYDFDVDGDGNADYRFNRADSLGVSVEPLGANRQIAFPAIPPDLGSYLDPLPSGFQIGSSLAPTYYWVSTSSPNLAGHSFVSACYDTGCIGLFHGQTAYMGLEFVRGNNTYYGWALINNPSGTAGGFILEWAYETQPGASIFAGAVPEPSTWALLVVGAAALVYRKSRRK